MLRFGIMGAGRIAKDFCDAASRAEGAEVVAVSSKSLQRAEEFAAEKGIERAYGDYSEMLSRPDIDVIYIATTTNYHYENLLMCIKAGKHILCEKAMVETEERAKEVFRLAKEKNLFLMEAMWTRFLPKTKMVRSWVLEGKIGEVKAVQGTIGFCAGKDLNNRFYNKALGGGAFYDLGVYLLDLMPYFAGKEYTVEQTSCDILFAPTGVDSTINLNITLPGCLANGQATFDAKVPEDCYVYGSEGYIYIPKIHFGRECIRYDKGGNEVERFADSEPCGFRFEIEEVVRCINEGLLESDVASHEMTLRSSRVYDKFLGSK